MKEEQEYYDSSYGYFTIWGEVKDHPELVVIDSREEGLTVYRRERLVKKEDSYEYKQRLKRKEELEAITKEAEENLNAIADKIVDRALKNLGTRMRFNTMFKPGMASSATWALTIIDELEKMIKEDTKENIKNKKV